MPRLPLRFPSYQLPPVSLSTSSSKLEGWENLNAAYAQNLFELEQANPFVKMLTTSLQGVADSVRTPVRWEAESIVLQRQGMLPISTGSTYIEIPFDGLWHVQGQVFWASTGGRVQAEITKTAGTGNIGNLAIVGDENAALLWQQVSITAPLHKGDRIALEVVSAGTTNRVGPFGGSEEFNTWISIAGVGVKAS